MAEKTVLVERRGRVLIARLRNPPHNFMNRPMVLELEELVSGLEGDSSIGSVVLTGDHPESFITHYDVREILAGSEQFGRPVPQRVAGGALRATGALSRLPGAGGALGRTPAAGALELRRIHDLFLSMNHSEKVFVAAINGVATGGGCELALACDVRIISEEGGPIGLPEMTVGIMPGAGGTQRLTRLLGQGRALEMILEGRALDPREAADVGLVHRVVPAAALLDEALTTAERLARRAPGTVEAVKRAVYEGATKSLDQGLHVERAAFLSIAGAPAALRGMRAYLDELEQRGEPPWRDEEAIGRWQDGTAVDLTTPGDGAAA
jgi:enoyl-CoA hydratase/carnithine racemase